MTKIKEAYSVHAVFGGGYQVYDPHHEIYVREDGRAFTDGKGRNNNWATREQAEAVAAKLNRKEGRTS